MTVGTEDSPVRLADQLATAEQAAVAPRHQADLLQTALQTAIAGGQFDEAHRLQTELEIAREVQAVAEAKAAALRDGAARIEQERNQHAQAIVAAQQRDQATRDLAAARGDESRAMQQVQAAIAAMRDSLAAAQHHLREAQAFESSVTDSRYRALQARGQLGEWPAGHPGPALARANGTEALISSDPMVRMLNAWSR
jgi:hypothetical protein